MSSSFVLKTTPSFERGFRALTKRDRELYEQFIMLLEILRIDPYNLSKQYDIKKQHDANIQDTEEIKEESLSIQDKEIELIKKALERHNGKRKLAADELGISERTLYRKIKEYDVDN